VIQGSSLWKLALIAKRHLPPFRSVWLNWKLLILTTQVWTVWIRCLKVAQIWIPCYCIVVLPQPQAWICSWHCTRSGVGNLFSARITFFCQQGYWRAGTWREHCSTALSKGGNGSGAEASFHNGIIGNFMVNKDRLETSYCSYSHNQKIQNGFL